MPRTSPITITKSSVGTIFSFSNHVIGHRTVCGGKKKTWRLWTAGFRLRIVFSLGVRLIHSSAVHCLMRLLYSSGTVVAMVWIRRKEPVACSGIVRHDVDDGVSWW